MSSLPRNPHRKRPPPPAGQSRVLPLKKAGGWSDFWAFRTMLTNSILIILFITYVAIASIFGIYLIITGAISIIESSNSSHLIIDHAFHEVKGKLQIMQGFGCLLSILVVRLAFEYAIVIYRINETLSEILTETKNSRNSLR